jgi:predicted transcriptional regulator
MARAVKMTFTLDQGTADRIDRTAERLGIPKSGVVREAVAEYAARAARLSEGERQRMLGVFDDAISRIPRRAAKATDRELLAIRSARRQGGRRTEAGRPHKARTGAGSRG